MSDRNYYSYVSPEDREPKDRAVSAGYTYSACEENIYAGAPSVDHIMKGWINSPEHRKGILTTLSSELGVGWVADGVGWTNGGMTYVTQLFASSAR